MYLSDTAGHKFGSLWKIVTKLFTGGNIFYIARCSSYTLLQKFTFTYGSILISFIGLRFVFEDYVNDYSDNNEKHDAAWKQSNVNSTLLLYLRCFLIFDGSISLFFIADCVTVATNLLAGCWCALCTHVVYLNSWNISV